MKTVRQIEIINAVNNNTPAKELNLNAGEKEFYDSLIAEKEEFKRKYNKDLEFELPMESYNDIW